jgi:hypothetical protein
MTKKLAAPIGLSIGLLAMAALVSAAALGQAKGGPSGGDATAGGLAKAGGAVVAGAASSDMRLWSFGECDRNFPFVDTPEHKECVRVVGSDEAKDTRAARVCETSHAKDPAEATRCKAAYLENKARAEHGGFRANPANLPPTVASPSTAPQRDQAAAIASLTRALTAPEPEEPAPPGASAPEPAAPPPPPESSSSIGGIVIGLAVMLLLAALALRYLRRVTGAAAERKVPLRKSGNAKTFTGVPRNQY